MGLNVALLRSSFEMVLEKEPALTKRFYEHLFADYPEAKPLFGNNSADRQQEMLAQALVAVVDHLEDAPWLESTLQGMGAKHVSYGVEDHMYDWVGGSLLKTLADVAGDAWNDELKQAWTDAYGAISGLMLQGASKAKEAA